jgi:uncharacterized protein (DUF302 family)
MNASLARPDPTDQVITKLSPWSVAETVARLSRIVADRGVKLFAIIDHSGEARRAGSSYATQRCSSSAARRQERP